MDVSQRVQDASSWLTLLIDTLATSSPTYGLAKECVEGGEIVLNGDAAGGCGVAVHRSSWTTIQCLYR